MKQYMDAIVKPTAGVGLELRQVPVPQPKAGRFLSKFIKPLSAVPMFISISGMTGLSSM